MKEMFYKNMCKLVKLFKTISKFTNTVIMQIFGT